MIQLRAYQKQMIDDIGYEFQTKNRVCAVAPCGAGKTITVGWMAAGTMLKGRRTLFLVHRQELIKQSVDTFRDMNILHGVIATRYPKQYDQLVQVGSVQTVVRRLGEIPAPDFIVIDECFVAGTKIDGKPIELLRVGDKISCFDEKTKQVKYSRVARIFKKPAPDILTKITVQGRSIVCTGNHPVFTFDGWKQAKNIRKGDIVYVCMSNMWRPKANVKIHAMSEMLQKRNGREKSPHGPGKDAHAKPYVQCADERESQRKIASNSAQASCAGREWDRADQTAKNAGASYRMERDGIRCPVRVRHDRAGIRTSLQNRHSQSEIKNCHRGRRKFSWFNGKAIKRYKKRSFIEGARVDCVEVYERANRNGFGKVCPDGYVYNVEVEKYHTYFANAVAVHNCHHAAARTWRKVIERFFAAKVLGVTATPERMGGHGLGDVFESLVIGPSTKELIGWGNLSPYQYYAPPVKFDDAAVRVKFGEYVKSDLEVQMDQNTVIGDIIANYQKLADGRRAVCYCVSLAHSRHIAASFRAAGIPAMHIDGETPEPIRTRPSKISGTTRSGFYATWISSARDSTCRPWRPSSWRGPRNR